MELDFSDEGVCHVKQFGHVNAMIADSGKNIGNKTAATSASNHLFDKGEGRLLSEVERESFHSTVAKGLYIST